MKRAQRGAGAVFIVIVLVIAALVVLAVGALVRSSNSVADFGQNTAHLAAAAAALEQFAGASGRLPCPANPNPSTPSLDGVEEPTTPTGNCDFPQGTLPWQTIGMRRDDSFDAWGWRISYRVYSNVVGSLTQSGGASMVNCTSGAPSLPTTVDANGLCQATHDTPTAAFTSGKGLSVTDFGIQYSGPLSTGAAYVLISHGPTGLGAYTASGAQQPMPASADELSNTTATGPFVAKAASNPDVSASDPTHFDDVLLYRTVTDLAQRANLAARLWPDTSGPLANVKFDSATLTAALGHAPGTNTGQTSIAFAGATVSAFNSGAARDISFSTAGGNSGIGEVGGGSNALTGSAGEGVRFALSQSARQFALTLNRFGTGSYFGNPYAEQVQVSFLMGGVTVDSVTKQACNAGSPLASYAITASADFDTVQVTALHSTISVVDSSFTISEFASCAAAAASCTTTLATAGNTCP